MEELMPSKEKVVVVFFKKIMEKIGRINGVEGLLRPVACRFSTDCDILRVCFKSAFYETLTGVVEYHFLFLFQ